MQAFASIIPVCHEPLLPSPALPYYFALPKSLREILQMFIGR